MAAKKASSKSPKTPSALAVQKMSFSASEPRIDNPLVQSIWFDQTTIYARGDAEVAMIRFYTSLPGRHFECARLQTSRRSLVALMNAMAASINYFPSREDADKVQREVTPD